MRQGWQCDFEEAALCGAANQAEGDNYDWDWVDGNKGAIGGYDHSYNTKVGHFLQIVSDDMGPGRYNVAKLKLPIIGNVPSGDHCFQLYYIRLGTAGSGILKIYIEADGNLELLVEINEDEEVSSWTLLQQTYVNRNDNATLQFVVRGDLDTLSDSTQQPVLAIDDFSFTSSGCPLPGSCAFDNAHICSWHTEKNGNLMWQLSNGLQEHGGPKYDHTNNSTIGGYIVVEDTEEQNGMATSLVSSFIPNDVYGYCFTFFYSLSGDQEAQLRVRIRRDSGNTTVWSLTGDQGTEWLYAQMGIPNSADEGFEIVVEGVVGSYANGWIALDDLYTYSGHCSTEPPDATLQPPVTSTAAPAGDIFSCDFEIDTCSMVQDKTDDFDWTHEHIEDSFEMPPGGHILVDATGHSFQEKAIITTPSFTVQGLQCVTFWYRFIGSESGILSLNSRSSSHWATGLWKRSGPTIPSWNSAMIDLDMTQSSYVVSAALWY
ncbi:MAM and LDL-receptor class A domain-containing protein 1 [Portunus trituberculatus]|uniref:MAM and LDL-receptor class A domain-containing protein 1 n=1 Tax=Portunus trituberculatus TaxID=210409 RepID=A0A5B7GNA0_PORTR|nr:MAM and LDL-receptor class A domain-containing protein 1 [Portunus trituberculatus]